MAAGPDDSTVLLKSILEEIKKTGQEKDEMRTEIQSLKETCKPMNQTLIHHQRYLEIVEARKRNHNLIMTGVDKNIDIKDQDQVASDDLEKVTLILSRTGNPDDDISHINRLGKASPEKSWRPIKFILTNATDRATILANTKELKSAGMEFKRIFVCKDVHTAIQKEFFRIKEVEKREKEKPEYAGRNVKYDRDVRILMVDDQVVN